jgi:predicted regulator of Ras-like GTPase activity (Roadblock/LC7/MglB family)
MRQRLMQDLADLDGVEWVVLIGDELLPLAVAPASEQAEAAAAMWIGLEFRAEVLLGGIPERLTIRADAAMMLSHRLDLAHVLLLRAGPEGNLGAIRLALTDAAERMVTLI